VPTLDLLPVLRAVAVDVIECEENRFILSTAKALPASIMLDGLDMDVVTTTISALTFLLEVIFPILSDPVRTVGLGKRTGQSFPLPLHPIAEILLIPLRPSFLRSF
jgi:hypothetical protein